MGENETPRWRYRTNWLGQVILQICRAYSTAWEDARVQDVTMFMKRPGP